MKGNALTQLKQFSEAKTAFEKSQAVCAHEQLSCESEAIDGLGRIESDLGHHKAAIELFHAALAKVATENNDPLLRISFSQDLAQSANAIGDYAEAIGRARDAVALAHEAFASGANEQITTASTVLANALGAAGQFDEGLRVIDDTIAKLPDDSIDLGDALTARAAMLIGMERYREASSDLERACDVKSYRDQGHGLAFASCLGAEADALIGLGKTADAKDRLTKAIRLYELESPGGRDEVLMKATIAMLDHDRDGLDHALGVLQTLEVPPEHVATVQIELANLIYEADPHRAEQLLHAAIGTLETAPSYAEPARGARIVGNARPSEPSSPDPVMCPTEETLVAFAHHALDDAGAEAIAAHLDTCEACRLAVRVGIGVTPSEDPPVRPSNLAIGSRLGRFELVRLVGAGGMGHVYAARDTELDREVALKVLRPGHGSIELEQRLLRESRLMAKVTHPAVITIYDVGHAGEVVFIAMELIHGDTLRPAADWRRTVERYLRAAEGLIAAHDAGVVHRDFKPDNVLFDPKRDRVVVTDFGIARATDATAETDVTLTTKGGVIGTPAYMAPEQLRGEAVDAKADVFAFAASLWEALHGERAFPGASIAEIRAAMARPPKPTTAIDRVLVKGLAIDPATRPTLRELTAQLRSVLRRRAVILVGAGAAVIVAGAIGFGAFALGGATAEEHPCAAPLHYSAGNPAIEQLASRWNVIHAVTCIADRSPPQDPAITACLKARRIELEGTSADLAEHHDADAEQFLALIGDPEDCLEKDPGAFASVPEDPALRAKVTAIRYQILDARNEKDFKLAVQHGNEIAIAAHDVWPAVEAEAWYELAFIEEGTGVDPAAAKDHVRKAAVLARGLHYDKLAIEASMLLIEIATFDEDDPAKALEYAAYVENGLEHGHWPAATHARYWFVKAGALMHAADHVGAIAAFQRSREICERERLKCAADAIEGLGRVASLDGRHGDAVKLFREALVRLDEEGEHDDVRKQSYNADLAVSLQSSGQYAEALAVGQQVIADNLATYPPDGNEELPVLQLALASAMALQGSYADALALVDAQLGKMTEATNNGGAAFEIKGEILALQGRYAEAKPIYEHACELAARHEQDAGLGLADCRNSLSETLRALGKTAEARALLERALATYKQKAPDHFERVMMDATIGMLDHDPAPLELALTKLDPAQLEAGHIASIQTQLANLIYPTDPHRAEELLKPAITTLETKTSPAWWARLREARESLATHGHPQHHLGIL
ncbi:MAG: protein kinase [Kofleriaceae bacterium]